MKTAFALCLIAGAALPAGAEDSLQRPKGCVLVATVQDDHCAATNYFKCTGAGPVTYRKEVHYGGGQVEIHSYDANYGGLEIVSPAGGAHYTIRSSGDHPRAVIAAKKVGKIEHATISRGSKTQTAEMVLNYTYSGKTRELGGVTFQRLEYATTIAFPASGSVLQTSGNNLYSEKLDLLVNELEVSDGQGGPSRKIKLKSLALDGQKGFGATKPKFGCN